MKASELFLNYQNTLTHGPALSGGKGWNLGKLFRSGLPIPPGGVLSTEAYQQYIKYNNFTADIDNFLNSLNISNSIDLEHDLTLLRQQIRQAALPPNVVEELRYSLDKMGLLLHPVAVRSSASAEDSGKASFAGIFSSYLNVSGWTQIEQAIKDCYASLWTTHALSYCQKHKLNNNEMLMAVVIMEMVDARVSGVAFSCDPQTGRRDRMVINANHGLGESVVSGTIEPDIYYLDRNAFKMYPSLLEKKIGLKKGKTVITKGGGSHFEKENPMAGQATLTDAEAETLGLFITRIFESLGEGENHQDVEWAYDGEKFIILQSRPVTALPEYTFPAIKHLSQVWSNGNYRDSLPMVLSPLHRALAKQTIDNIQYSNFTEIAYPIPEGFHFSRYFHGRLYCNTTALQWAHFDCSGAPPEALNPNWGGQQSALDVKSLSYEYAQTDDEKLKNNILSGNLVTKANEQSQHIFTGLNSEIDSILNLYLTLLSNQELISIYDKLGLLLQAYSNKFSFLSAVGSIPFIMLLQELAPYLGAQLLNTVNDLMITNNNQTTSAEQGYRLMELAVLARQDRDAVWLFQQSDDELLDWKHHLPETSVFKEAFQVYINDYGHRAVYELDVINPRWSEDPAYLLRILKDNIDTADLDTWKIRQAEKFKQAWKKIEAQLPQPQHVGIQEKITVSQHGFGVREMAKSMITKTMMPYRKLALEVGRRFYEQGLLQRIEDIFFVSWADIAAVLSGLWDGANLSDLADDNKMAYEQNEALVAPDLIEGDRPVFVQPISAGPDEYLMGIAAVSGKASGKASVITNPAHSSYIEPGSILVAPSTDPAWTPLFTNAGGIVMETGGFMSHGTIVAREYGIPAVVNVAGALQIISEGQTILVDGNEGKVFLEGGRKKDRI